MKERVIILVVVCVLGFSSIAKAHDPSPETRKPPTVAEALVDLMLALGLSPIEMQLAIQPETVDQVDTSDCIGAWKLFNRITLNGKTIFRQTETFFGVVEVEQVAYTGQLNELQIDLRQNDDMLPTVYVDSYLVPIINKDRGNWGASKMNMELIGGFFRHWGYYIESRMGGLHELLLDIGIVNPDTNERTSFCQLAYQVNFVDPTLPTLSK